MKYPHWLIIQKRNYINGVSNVDKSCRECEVGKANGDIKWKEGLSF